ncbi:MAG: HAD-IA family hydrolase [Nitrospirae bacterium]|nr:HAD-IA family hydrolase [Nitrospirota bacterium]
MGLPIRQPIKLIIFDLDGTLVDSIADIAAALNYTLTSVGLPDLTIQEVKGYVGEGVDNLLMKATEGRLIEKMPLIKETFIDYYLRHVMDSTRPYDKVVQTLESLSGYKKAVVSNKTEMLSKQLLTGLAMAQHFDLIIGSDTLNERKPSPVPILKAMEILDATPHETLMVGDSSYDIEAGRAASVTTIGVAYGYRPVDTLKDADFIINKEMSELLQILG